MKKSIIILLLLTQILKVYSQSVSTVLDTLKKVDQIELLDKDSIASANDKPVADKKSKSNVSPPDISELVSMSKIFWSLIFFIIGYLIIKIIARILEILAEKSTTYRITIKSFIPVVKIVGWVGLIFLIVAGVFNPPAATVLAFSASIGVAVAFASQDILKNIFGGVMILFDRPFKSGDKIDVSGHYGEVIEIGLRSTRIVTPDDNLVSIPNSEIMNSSVSNANAGESNCQVAAEIYLPLEINTAHVRSIATQAAQVSQYIYLNKPITVIFTNEYKEKKSIIKMKLKAYVLDIRDEFKFKSEMTENVLRKLLEEKIINP